MDAVAGLAEGGDRAGAESDDADAQRQLVRALRVPVDRHFDAAAVAVVGRDIPLSRRVGELRAVQNRAVAQPPQDRLLVRIVVEHRQHAVEIARARDFRRAVRFRGADQLVGRHAQAGQDDRPAEPPPATVQP